MRAPDGERGGCCVRAARSGTEARMDDRADPPHEVVPGLSCGAAPPHVDRSQLAELAALEPAERLRRAFIVNRFALMVSQAGRAARERQP